MSVTPNVRNCCDLALTKCLRIMPCSHFCLTQRLCKGNCPSVSYEDVNGVSPGQSAYDGAKLSFDQSSRCCGTVKVGDKVSVILRNTTVDEGGWSIAKIEAGKITLKNSDSSKGYLVLNGINGHLCSVFHDSEAADICAICPEVRFDIARSSKAGTCSAASCNQCTC